MATIIPGLDNRTVTIPKRTLPNYRDFGKAVNDLFTKGFPNTRRFEINTAAENGLKFTAAAETKRRKVDDSNKDASPEYIFGSFQPKLELKNKGINFIGTIDSEKVAAELALSDLFTPGLKSTIKANATDKDFDTSADIQFQADSATISAGLFSKGNKPRLETTAVVGRDNLNLGGSLSYFIPFQGHAGTIDSFSLGADYVTSTYDFLVAVNGKYDKGSPKLSLGSRLLYTHSLTNQFAADVNYDLSAKSKSAVGVKILGSHKFNSDASGKAKFDTDGNVGLAFSQKLNTNLTLTVGSEFNVLKADESKYGFGLVFNP